MAKKNIAIIVIVVAIAIVVGLYFINRNWIKPVAAQQEQAQAKPGDFPMAPDFTLTDIFGKKLSLSEYRGKVVLLDFWATWCGPCRMEIPGFVQLQKRYGADGFQAIGLSMDDSPQPVLAFYKQFNMDYPVAMGSDKVSELYGGIVGLPTTFLIGRDGRIYDKVPGAVDVKRFDLEIQTLLSASSNTEAKSFKPEGPSGDIQLETPAEANSVVPGIDLTKLSKTQIAQYKDRLSKQNCDCGCNYNLLQCRINDPSCEISRDRAKAVLAKLEKSNHPI
ncbi:MAG: TlpA family protein disulfide reductase [Terriglobia bacterium]